MKRRTVILLGAGTAGAVISGWSLMPPRQRLVGSNPLPVASGEVSLNGWLKLGPDSSVTLMMPKSEMGQGIFTALAMLVAEELDCAWSSIRIEPSPLDKIYGNLVVLADGLPFRPEDEGVVARTARWFTTKITRELGLLMTGGSSSVRDLWMPLREASAIVRASLINTVSAQWNVDTRQLSVKDGVITGLDGKSITFGEIVQKYGGQIRAPGTWTMKTPSQFQVIGKSMPRLDGAAKARGTTVFGIDTVQPGMLYAAVKMAPTLNGTVKSFDATSAETLPGVKKIVSFPATPDAAGGISVIADRYWRARKALDTVKVVWTDVPSTAPSSPAITAQLREAAEKKSGFTFWKTGDVNTAFSTAAKKVEAEYHAPLLAHAAMEPSNCVIEVHDNSATIWAPTQVPNFVQAGVAKELGLPASAVTVHVTFLGGGFGRRLEIDTTVQAAAIAKQLRGVPIQVLWSREEDIRHDFYRPPCVSRFEGALDKDGKLLAWRNHSAGPAVVAQYVPRNLGVPGMGPDKTTAEGAFDQPYEFPNAHIAHETVPLNVPLGFFRSVGHSHQAFFKEGFLDEMANAAGADSYEFRAALLARHPRHRAVLDLAATKAGWGTPPPAGHARGIALHESFNSIVAQVAEVSIKEGKLVVHRVVCAIDCGLAVNPGLIIQQMESSIIFGMSMALYGDITLKDGAVQQSNFHDYRIVRMNESPLIEVHVVPSTHPPEGVGEPGVPPVAPAIANAIYALTKQRLRSLPLTL